MRRRTYDCRDAATYEKRWWHGGEIKDDCVVLPVSGEENYVLNIGDLDVEIEANDIPEELRVRFAWEVCRVCRGNGHHVNPSIDAHGITWQEFDDDPEFEEEYRSGFYNVTCYECKGLRVLPSEVVSCDRMDVFGPYLEAVSEVNDSYYDNEY